MKKLINYKLYITLLFFVCFGITSMAQTREDFERYKKEVKKDFNRYKSEREADFNRYREKRNREFAKYLSERWKEVKPHKAITPPAQPKPFVPAPQDNKGDEKIEELPTNTVVKEAIEVQPTKPITIEKPTAPKVEYHLDIPSFYGKGFRLRSTDKVKISLSTVNPKNISKAWEDVAVKELDPLVYDCQQTRNTYKYCDWLYYQFIRTVAQTFTGKGRHNEEILLTGYLMAQSGMDFRFAYNNNKLYIALPFSAEVYMLSYISVNNKNFYVLDYNNNEENIYIMEKEFCDNSAIFTLNTIIPIEIHQGEKITRELKSSKYPELSVTFETNKNLLDFYSTYPKMEWDKYTLTPIAKNVSEKILPRFRNAIKGKSEEEAVNMILNFVQTAFTYGYDDKIWGYDRPFFADETLYYPQSDCEDRSILFAQLIRKLTNLDVVLLHYPNHLATAVRFSKELQGDYVIVDGKKYLVCDPTGHKPIGNAYDIFKNTKANIIKIK